MYVHGHVALHVTKYGTLHVPISGTIHDELSAHDTTCNTSYAHSTQHTAHSTLHTPLCTHHFAHTTHHTPHTAHDTKQLTLNTKHTTLPNQHKHYTYYCSIITIYSTTALQDCRRTSTARAQKSGKRMSYLKKKMLELIKMREKWSSVVFSARSKL
jgi:hypothetical protein